MALGKIKADTLEHSTAGTVDTQFVVNGSTKCWLSGAAGGGSPRNSLNVASITDVSTGKFKTNTTSAFTDATHCTSTGLEMGDGTNAAYFYQQILIDRTGETASVIQVNMGYANGSSAFEDTVEYWHQTSGDLA